MNPTHIILHHTALPYTTTSAAAVRVYHIEKRGWDDIGYHYLIRMARGFPVVEVGRPTDQRGAHCWGYNKRSIGVCVAGDWSSMDPGNYPRLWERTAAWVRTLMVDHKIPAANVLAHREADKPDARRGRGISPTECPGLRLNMDSFRKLLEQPDFIPLASQR